MGSRVKMFIKNCFKLCAFLVVTFTFYVCILAVSSESEDELVFEAGNNLNVQFGSAKATRYILYEVNPGEGFNLRRDVYMRVANLVKELNEDESWTLVLPPWRKLYHWKSEVEQSRVPWSTFFHLPSLRRLVPVIEFEDFIKVNGPAIDEIYYLQRFKEGWGGKWVEKLEERECIDDTQFRQDKTGKWYWWFWNYKEVYGRMFKCLSTQMQATSMKPFLTKNTTARSVFLLRAEQLIHGSHSEWSERFWTARRSMVFAEHLRIIGDEFRKTIGSSDELDKTPFPADGDWTSVKREHGDAVGGPYVAIHLRRRDFLYGHKDDVPSIKGAANQIAQVLKRLDLDTVFIATDAPKEEFDELKGYMLDYKVVRYTPTREILDTYKDGGVAIIDQWICAHARYFMGTSVSTFTFRIHEEREILGFDPKMTFNRLCADEKPDCEQPSKWTVKY